MTHTDYPDCMTINTHFLYPDDPEASQLSPECTAAAESMMEVRLRDLLLDIEDRIHQGTLGTLKVSMATNDGKRMGGHS